ncbi:MAG: 3-oxoacyl-ACP reductase FabG [Chlamydiales bacterium]|nr:3-oxoacyl-ACP reductase FabG [Chlamydiia bacterium]MCP5504783.1 3-oxoacyl-ACP reductase FabG [Chlamydiales bacterium]
MALLKGKRALITGGTSGLGKQIALTFAEEGADVAIMGTNQERAQLVLETLKDSKISDDQKFWSDIVNVAKKEEVNQSIERLTKEWGGVDILVNCAGITRDTLFMKMSEDDWDQVINTNLKSVYNLSHALVRPMMKARKGKIINVASVIGLTGNPGQVNYSASKLGMVGFTRSLAKELGPRNINVNCIAPGFFETPMTNVLTEEQREGILKKVPMGRLGNPKEIAHAAVFLASHMSDYITGQILTVDGGMIA